MIPFLFASVIEAVNYAEKIMHYSSINVWREGAGYRLEGE